MNPIIEQYFDTIEAWLIDSPAITSYQVLRREVTLSDGKLRIKAALCDKGTVELFEYVSESRGQIQLLKYSFHWQDTQGNLICRWDNAPHHKDLPHSPHHIHYRNELVEDVINVPNILSIIEKIEGNLK